MPARPGKSSQEGYSSSPSTEAHLNDPFNSQPRYYDNESDNVDYGRRDTYASDTSHPGYNDPGYYDQNNYDAYRMCFSRLCRWALDLSFSTRQLLQTLTRMAMCTANDMHLLQSLWRHRHVCNALRLFSESLKLSTGPAGVREDYPAWTVERQIPLSKEEIEDVFLDLTQKFGFQRDSMRNMVRVELIAAVANYPD